MSKIPRNPAAKKFSRKGWKKSLPKVSKVTKQSVVTPAAARKIAKKVMIKNTEQKYVDTNIAKLELYHNSYLTNALKINLTDPTACLPSQGDTDNTRDGNKIYVSGISLPMMLYAKGDRLNTKFRVIAFRYAQGYNPFATYESLFENISGNTMLDKVNPDVVKILFDKIVTCGKINPGSTGQDEITVFRKYWIPIKRNFTFRADNTQYYNNPSYHFGLVVVAYDTYGTVQTDNIGAVQVWSRLYFKDV